MYEIIIISVLIIFMYLFLSFLYLFLKLLIVPNITVLERNNKIDKHLFRLKYKLKNTKNKYQRKLIKIMITKNKEMKKKNLKYQKEMNK